MVFKEVAKGTAEKVGTMAVAKGVEWTAARIEHGFGKIGKKLDNKVDQLFRDSERPKENELPESNMETEITDKEEISDSERPKDSNGPEWDEKEIDGKNLEVDEGAEEKDLPEQSEKDEVQEKKGGSYRDVKKTSDGEIHEVHHMPADSASNLERDDGPAIKMEKEDHRQTASCGSSKEAREYREQQKELIEQGKFKEALQMDIDDIHDKFGDKYDDAINEMLDYVNELEQEGKI
mgnify:CR=1 FL=1